MKHFHHTLKVGCKNSELFLKQNTVFIDDAKKWLVAVLPPTTFVTITNQKCQLYPFFSFNAYVTGGACPKSISIVG